MASIKLNKFIKLTKEEAEKLAKGIRDRFLPHYVDLADWRNRSGSSPEYIPLALRVEAERCRRKYYPNSD